MSDLLFGRKPPPGGHFGDIPASAFQRQKLRSMHRLGYNTILSADYEALILVGYEPDDLGRSLQLDDLSSSLTKDTGESLV